MTLLERPDSEEVTYTELPFDTDFLVGQISSLQIFL